MLLLTAFISLLAITQAAKPASFCKCTCFSNSTIIPLGTHRSETMSPRPLSLLEKREPLGPGQLHPLNLGDPSRWRRDEDTEEDGEKEVDGSKGRVHTGTCADCNRALCIEYGLLACKDAEEKDIFATCFQRDSRKDEAVVFIFIFATVGLLFWAAVRPWVGKWVEAARERRSYAPVSEGVDSG